MTGLTHTVEPLGTWTRPAREPVRCPFRVTPGKALRELMRELERAGAVRVVLHLDVGTHHIRQDGQLHANAVVRSNRVRVRWETRDAERVLEADTYPKAFDNLRAIGLTLERTRAIERYGVVSLEQMHRSFGALPGRVHEVGGRVEVSDGGFATVEDAARWLLERADPGGPTGDDFVHDVIYDDEVRRDIKRHAARRLHPDVGGDGREFARIDVAVRMIEESAGYGCGVGGGQ